MTRRAPLDDGPLLDHLLGDLDAAEDREVIASLRADPELRARATEYEAILDAARSRPAPDAPPEVLGRLLEAHRRAFDGDDGTNGGNLSRGLPMVGVLTLVMMLLLPPVTSGPGPTGLLVDSSLVMGAAGPFVDSVAAAPDSMVPSQPALGDTGSSQRTHTTREQRRQGP